MHLRAGEAVFYHSSVLHRGVYSTAPRRLTLHPNLGFASAAGRRSLDSHYGWLGSAPEDWVAGLPLELQQLARNTARSVDHSEQVTSGHMGHGALGRDKDGMAQAPPKM